MNYKKKYKDALERAKIELNADTTQGTKNVLMTVFPELKESEDEKIKETLIDYFKKQEECGIKTFFGIPTDNIIAWLEKQGEKKVPINDFKAKDWYVSKVDGNIHNMTYDAADKVEPRFKVKYAGSEYNVLEVKDIAGVTFYGIEDEPNHIDYVKAENCEIISGYAIKENGSPYPTKPAVLSKKKPTAWSDEDERLRNSCIKHIEEELEEIRKDRFGHSEIISDLKESCRERINWLKSLKKDCYDVSKNQIEQKSKDETKNAQEALDNWYVEYVYILDYSTGRIIVAKHDIKESFEDFFKKLGLKENQCHYMTSSNILSIEYINF